MNNVLTNVTKDKTKVVIRFIYVLIIYIGLVILFDGKIKDFNSKFVLLLAGTLVLFGLSYKIYSWLNTVRSKRKKIPYQVPPEWTVIRFKLWSKKIRKCPDCEKYSETKACSNCYRDLQEEKIEELYFSLP